MKSPFYEFPLVSRPPILRRRLEPFLAACVFSEAGYNPNTTDAEQIQYDRLLEAGYSVEDGATLMIKRGVWLGTTHVSEQTIANIQRYRTERDGRGDQDAADTQPKLTPP